MYTIQDYSLISSYVQRYKADYSIEEDSIAFYFLILDLLTGIGDDEARDSITDNYFLKKYGDFSGHDRGIDAVYIENDGAKSIIHLFNFKYAMSFEKSKSYLESNEIDKIEGFLNRLMLKEKDLKNEINAVLYSKVEEIWELFEKENPLIVIHICSNTESGYESSEKTRFEKGVNKFSNIGIQYFQAESIVDKITNRNRRKLNSKIKAIDLNLFEKSDGSIRALIVNLDARDLIRAILDDETIRNDPDFSDYDRIREIKICEDAFEDNVRLYLKRETRINNNIIDTALSDENYQFFYFNNGITITCDHFTYPKNRRTPIIEIENIQVVNGGQTIHALYEALNTDIQKTASVNLLCRIYETKDKELSSRIAEYTNSQNPVNNRDIHSIDSLQIKLEKEFLAFGYYYERKRNQYITKPKASRIDSEKVGQAILAFLCLKPSEAKNHKKQIFDEYYDDVFTPELRAEKALLAYQLLDYIEEKKNLRKKEIIENYDSYGFISYSTYWVLYLQYQIAKKIGLNIEYANIEKFKKMYDEIMIILAFFADDEKGKKGDSYSHGLYFKYNQIKKAWEDYADSEMLAKQIVKITEYSK